MWTVTSNIIFAGGGGWKRAEIFDKEKSRILARAPPQSYYILDIGAKDAFRKILQSVGQKWIF